MHFSGRTFSLCLHRNILVCPFPHQQRLFHLGGVMVYPFFFPVTIRSNRLSHSASYRLKNSIAAAIRFALRATVSNFDTHQAHTFESCNSLCMIFKIIARESGLQATLAKYRSISRTVHHLSSENENRTMFTMSSLISLGLPDLFSSITLVRHFKNCLCHLQTYNCHKLQ